jgi:hypothetical protein
MLTLALVALLQAAPDPLDVRVRELIERLEDADIAVRDAAAVELRSLGERAHARLREALTHADGEVRARAEHLLAPPPAVESPDAFIPAIWSPGIVVEWPVLERPVVEWGRIIEAPAFEWPKVELPKMPVIRPVELPKMPAVKRGWPRR